MLQSIYVIDGGTGYVNLLSFSLYRFDFSFIKIRDNLFSSSFSPQKSILLLYSPSLFFSASFSFIAMSCLRSITRASSIEVAWNSSGTRLWSEERETMCLRFWCPQSTTWQASIATESTCWRSWQARCNRSSCLSSFTECLTSMCPTLGTSMLDRLQTTLVLLINYLRKCLTMWVSSIDMMIHRLMCI